MAIKKRCPRCLQVLRDNGTCQNPNCVKFVSSVTAEKDEQMKGK